MQKTNSICKKNTRLSWPLRTACNSAEKPEALGKNSGLKAEKTMLFWCLNLVFVFCLGIRGSSQTIKPLALPFERICADRGFNEFNATFDTSGFAPTADFAVELSDENGNFSKPVAVNLISKTDVTVNRKLLKFAVPDDLKGSEKYSLRVREKNSGIASDAFLSLTGAKQFSAYYKIHNAPFAINSLKPAVVICKGGSYTLTIDAPEGGAENSPLKYPSLRYNWYKNSAEGLSETLVAANSTGFFTVKEPGIYYAETNYGECTSDSYSNQVTVTESDDDSGTMVSSSLGNPFCVAEGPTVLNAAEGTSYQWFKDKVRIEGAVKQTYSASEAGTYTVSVGSAGCAIESSIELKAIDFSAALDLSGNAASIDAENGESLLVSVACDAADPSYQWFFNGQIIADAVSDSYAVRLTGTYEVIITQTAGCHSSRKLNFRVSDSRLLNIPNIVNLNSPSNFWDIPSEYKNQQTKVTILSSYGETVFSGTDYDPFKWEIKDFKGISPVYYYIIKKTDQQEKKGSITILR